MSDVIAHCPERTVPSWRAAPNQCLHRFLSSFATTLIERTVGEAKQLCGAFAAPVGSVQTGSGMLRKQNVRRHWRLYFIPSVICCLLPPPCFSADGGGGLAPIFAQEVDRRLELPDMEQRSYADLLSTMFADREIAQAQYVVLVDRNEFVQAAMIYWITPERVFKFIGASPVSTGKAGRFDYFTTPSGIFEHTTDNLDFRALGTRNKLGFRGYGRKGFRIYDFGWQKAARGWGKGGESTIRLQMHSTDPDRLEIRMGSAQSKGCIRIPATLNAFIDRHAILDADYEDAMKEGKTFWVLAKTRESTPFSGRFLIVVNTERTARPEWSPLPSLP